jgi:hypothetical protein
MALLSFPASPTNGQLYPTTPLPGQSQYEWSATDQTWRLLGTATAVNPGTYGDGTNVGQFTVDATGKITFAQNVAIPSTLPATLTTLGLVKPDGTTITVAPDGTISSIAAGTGTVTSVATGTGLTGGPITSTGTIRLANTSVVPGVYTLANITVDAQGRITFASNGVAGSGTVRTVATGTGLTGGPVTTTGTISLANTAVSPGVYGSASSVGRFTVDAQGRITSATNVPITFPTTLTFVAAPTASTSAGVSGQIAVNGTYLYVYTGARWQRVAWDAAPW